MASNQLQLSSNLSVYTKKFAYARVRREGMSTSAKTKIHVEYQEVN